MSLEISEATRKDSRFEVDSESGSPFSVLIHRSTDDGRSTIEAVPVDVSATGIKVVCPDSIPFQEVVRLEFRTGTSKFGFETEAEIRWIRPHEEGWTIGFRTTDELSDYLLQSLSVAGGIERREMPRYDAEAPTEIQLAGSEQRASAMILDFSFGGVRLSTDAELQVGDALKLFIPAGENNEESEVVGRVRWAVSLETGSLAGIRINQSYLQTFRDTAIQLKQKIINEHTSPWLPVLVAAFTLVSALLFLGYLR